MNTNVISERIGTLQRKDAGKVFETVVALTSGVGGVSYAVQGIMTLMVALPINTPPSQYIHVWLRAMRCKVRLNYRFTFHLVLLTVIYTRI